MHAYEIATAKIQAMTMMNFNRQAKFTPAVTVVNPL